MERIQRTERWCGMKKRKDGRYEKSIIIDGKRKIFYGKTQREVMEKIMRFEEEKEAGPLFSTLVDEWEAERERDIAYETMRVYQIRIGMAAKRFKNVRVKAITPKMIQMYIQHLAGMGLAYKTVSSYLSVLNLVFKYAVVNGFIDNNPTEMVQVPANLSRTPRELPSDEDIKKIIQSVNLPFGLYAYLLLYTGLRKGEALALTYQDIDYENETININKSLYYERGKGYAPKIKKPKTKSGIRSIPLLKDLKAFLPYQDIGIVFPGKQGSYMPSWEYDTAWKNYSKEAGISCTAHQLRHGLATFLFEAGIDEKDAQEILGHADISTTKNIYTHIRDSRRKQTAEKLNEYISSSEFRQTFEQIDNKAK